MNDRGLALASYRFRRTLRRRLTDYLTVVLLVGLVGGLGLAALAGARRTDSAYPVFLRSSHASDLQVQFYRIGNALPGSDQLIAVTNGNLYSPAVTAALARLPGVRRVAAFPQMFFAPLNTRGQPELTSPIQTNLVSTVGSVGGEFFSQDAVVADQGRLADPGRANEVMITAKAAALLHWRVGQRIRFGGYSFAQVASTSGPPTTPPVIRLNATVVGIVARGDSVAEDEVDQYPTFVIFTPALTRMAIAAKAAGFSEYTLSLTRGAAGVASVERE